MLFDAVRCSRHCRLHWNSWRRTKCPTWPCSWRASSTRTPMPRLCSKTRQVGDTHTKWFTVDMRINSQCKVHNTELKCSVTWWRIEREGVGCRVLAEISPDWAPHGTRAEFSRSNTPDYTHIHMCIVHTHLCCPFLLSPLFLLLLLRLKPLPFLVFFKPLRLPCPPQRAATRGALIVNTREWMLYSTRDLSAD